MPFGAGTGTGIRIARLAASSRSTAALHFHSGRTRLTMATILYYLRFIADDHDTSRPKNPYRHPSASMRATVRRAEGSRSVGPLAARFRNRSVTQVDLAGKRICSYGF